MQTAPTLEPQTDVDGVRQPGAPPPALVVHGRRVREVPRPGGAGVGEGPRAAGVARPGAGTRPCVRLRRGLPANITSKYGTSDTTFLVTRTRSRAVRAPSATAAGGSRWWTGPFRCPSRLCRERPFWALPKSHRSTFRTTTLGTRDSVASLVHRPSQRYHGWREIHCNKHSRGWNPNVKSLVQTMTKSFDPRPPRTDVVALKAHAVKYHTALPRSRSEP